MTPATGSPWARTRRRSRGLGRWTTIGAMTQTSAAVASTRPRRARSAGVQQLREAPAVRRPRSPSAGFSSSSPWRRAAACRRPASRVRTTTLRSPKAWKTSVYASIWSLDGWARSAVQEEQLGAEQADALAVGRPRPRRPRPRRCWPAAGPGAVLGLARAAAGGGERRAGFRPGGDRGLQFLAGSVTRCRRRRPPRRLAVCQRQRARRPGRRTAGRAGRR